MAETDIRTKIKNWLNSLPESYFEVSPPGSLTGKPDITGSLGGRYVGVECKKPKKQGGRAPRKAQEYVHRKLRAAGALIIVARRLEDVSEHPGIRQLVGG